jgi:hypothetical protein
MRFACATNNCTESTSASSGYQTLDATSIDTLIAVGYVISKINNCLFYRVFDVEITFIVLFVDDTMIFSKWQEDIDEFSERLNRHYELALDAKGRLIPGKPHRTPR